MGDAMMNRYWCYICSQMVNPVMEADIKCPFCESGFLEEMGSMRDHDNNGFELGSGHAFSLWDPFLLDNLMGDLGPSGSSNTAQDHISASSSPDEDDELERDHASLPRRRGRSQSSSVPRLLQDLHLGSENSEHYWEGTSGSSTSNSSRVILVNPFNDETIILHNTLDMSHSENPTQNVSGAFRDYLIGPGLDLLLQHLAESGPIQCGTPPADKDAVKALRTVPIEQNLQCSICLEEFKIGYEAKEMPCKHKFHGECIVPWLELHSTCPVCRFQMPPNDSKTEVNGLRSDEERMEVNDTRRYWVPIPWPFDGLFPLSGSQNGGGGSSTSETPSATMPASASFSDET